jgi:O-antigen/teichoic acid export membrane protein
MSGLSPRELQQRAMRGVAWSSISGMVSLPLAIVASAVVARSLGPQEFARFAYLHFLVPLLLVVSDLGFGDAMKRTSSQAFAVGDLARTRELLGKTMGWNLVRLPVICALSLAVARPGLEIALVLVGGLVLLSASAGLTFSLHAENRGATDAKLSFLRGLATGVSSIIGALAGASGTALWAITFVSAVVAVPGWIIVANPALRRAALTPRLPRALPERFWTYGLTVLVSTVLSILVFSRSEVMILEALGQQQALAIFALAFGLAQRLTTPVDTILGPLVPALSALSSASPERMDAGFGRALRLSATAVACLASAAGVGTVLAAPVLFGPEYAGIGLVFAALAAISLVQSAVQPYLALAYALGRPGFLIRVNAIALAGDVAVALALIPTIGLWGAVIANAVGGILAIGLTVRWLPGTNGVRAARVPLAGLLRLAVLSCLAAYVLGLLAGGLHPAAGALVAFVVGSSSFFVLARLFGGPLPAGDAAVLLDVLPARLARFTRSTIIARPEPAAGR